MEKSRHTIDEDMIIVFLRSVKGERFLKMFNMKNGQESEKAAWRVREMLKKL